MMIKIPSLPFASSIVGGEHHAGVQPENEEVFSLYYMARLYKVHHDETPQLLSDKLTKNLIEYVRISHKDLATVMFERQLQWETHGVFVIPIPLQPSGRKLYLSVAYQFVQDEEGLEVTISVMGYNSQEVMDCPFFAFTAKIINDEMGIGIQIPAEVLTPLIANQRRNVSELNDMAWYLVRLISAYEAMLAYQCVPYKSYRYEPMLVKDGMQLNPNFVTVQLLMSDDEKVGK